MFRRTRRTMRIMTRRRRMTSLTLRSQRYPRCSKQYFAAALVWKGATVAGRRPTLDVSLVKAHILYQQDDGLHKIKNLITK
jgi:hypothetical protein